MELNNQYKAIQQSMWAYEQAPEMYNNFKTNMKDTYEKIQALLTEQLQTPDPLTYKEFYTELMKLRQELRKR